MKDPFVLFWAALIFSSIAWYAFLVFYVGIKAGREILTMTRDLTAAHAKTQGKK
jgi:hypothetical protein